MIMSKENYLPYPDRAPARRTNLTRINSVALVILSLQLVACGGVPDDPLNDTRQTLSPSDIATQVVADFLSLPASEITLVSTEAKNFGDSSLDCPEAGMSYAQVITPGHRIVVEADGRRFDVRISGTHGKICRKPRGKGPPDKPDSPPPEQVAPITSQIDLARTSIKA